jgi:hypothetical protein
MFKGKRFQDNSTGKIVSVTNENGTWITLDDSTNIKTNVFLQKYTEYIEVDNFFTSDPVMENLANQFNQTINLNTVPIVGQDGTNITYSNPNPVMANNTSPAGYFVDDNQMAEARKRELLEKYQNYQPPTTVDAIDMSQIGVPENQRREPLQQRVRPVYVPPPEESERVIKNATTGEIIQNERREPYVQPPQPPPIQRIETPLQPSSQPIEKPEEPKIRIIPEGTVPPKVEQPPTTRVFNTQEEEDFMFFKKFKKVYPIKINVSFDETIANPDYVRQTAMNFEGDIIKFYTKELMKKIWADPAILENQIYDNLKKNIIGDPSLPKDNKIDIKNSEVEVGMSEIQ